MAIGNEKVIEIQLKLLDEISGNLAKTIGVMKQTEAQADKLTKAEKELDTQTKKTGDSFSTMGRNLLGFAAAYVGVSSAINRAEQAMRFIVQTGSEFEQSMANTRAILQPTSEDFAALSKEAFNLGKTTIFTAAQAGDAFTELGKLGFSTSQILSAGNDVLSLAAATNIEMGRAAEVSATVLNQFNLEAGRTAEVVDTIAMAMNISAIDIDGFAKSMKYVGPVASQAGESIASTSAALSVLADNGLQSQTAGTGMRRVLTMLADSGSKASKAIASVNPEAKSFADKLAVLKQIGMDTTMAVDFFGLEAQTAATILANNVPKLRQYGEALEWVDGKAKGYAQTVADIQIDTFGGDIRLLRSNVEALGITFFEAFGPQLRKGVAVLNEEVSKLSQWAMENPEQIEQWSRVALDAFNSVLSVAKLVGGAIETIASAMAAMAPESVEFDMVSNFRDASREMEKLAEQTKEYEKYSKSANENNLDAATKVAWSTRLQESKKAYDLQRQTAKEALDQIKLEVSNTERLISMKVDVSKEDRKRLVTLRESIPAMEEALRKEISLDEARRRIAQKTVDERKAQGNTSKVKTKTSGEIDPMSGVYSSEETDKAGKAALESWERLLREREQIGMDAEARAIRNRQNYWDDLIAIDQKAKGEHLDQLRKWKDEEIALMLAPQFESSFSYASSFSGRSAAGAGYAPGDGTNAGPGIDGDKAKRLQEALSVQNELISSQYDLERQREAARYDERKELLQEFNMDTEALTADHEKRMSEISRKEWEMRGAVMAGFFGSMSQLLVAAGGENRKYAKAAQAMAIAEVTINTAIAVSKVWGQTGILGVMAQAAPIMAGAAQILAIKQQRFAEGGIVAGSSYYGDKVQARVNSGEMILTTAQQATLFAIANGRAGVNQGPSISISYAPVFPSNVSREEISWSHRELRREIKSIMEDPSFAYEQGALA
jgi:TP901 family phage tail tape measure protein